MNRLLWQELLFRRNGIIGWGLGLTFFPLIYMGIYPQVAAEMQNFEALMELQMYQVMGISLGTFEDWMASTVILFVPLLASIYAIINGTGTLAGEDDDGRLEMMVTLPVPRWKIVTVKAIALSIALLIIILIVSMVTVGVFLAIESAVETTADVGNVFVAALSVWPMTVAIGMISLFLGAFCPSRRVAALLAAAVLIIGYFGSNLAGMASALEPLKPFFLFTYLDATGNIVFNGPELSDILVLTGVALVAFGLAAFFFQLRDVTVGAWPWQRARARA